MTGNVTRLLKEVCGVSHQMDNNASIMTPSTNLILVITNIDREIMRVMLNI